MKKSELKQVIKEEMRKVLKEEYIESMNHIVLSNAMSLIIKQWEKWKEGPLTEPKDIKPAQKELIGWIMKLLKKHIK